MLDWRGFADSYAAFYVRSAFGNDAYEARMSGLRDAVEDPTEYRSNQNMLNRARRPLSLTGATRYTDVSDKLRADYGAYVMADMIRLRVGDYAYFYALDRLSRQISSVPGSRLSTDELQGAFEASSGQDLSISSIIGSMVGFARVNADGHSFRSGTGRAARLVLKAMCRLVPWMFRSR